MKKLLLFLFIVLNILGCSKKEEEQSAIKNYFYDPKIPYGVIKENGDTIGEILNLKADVSVLDQIKLTWTVPPLYLTMNHKIVVFKRQSSPEDFVLPDPSDEANGAMFYKYKEIVGNELLDKNEIAENGDPIENVSQGTDYTYWLFVLVDDKKWSKGVKINVRTKTPSTDFSIPEPSKFWDNKKWTLGYDPVSAGPNGSLLNFLQSMNPGVSTPDEIKGGLSFAASGNVLYIADTNNNRVLIYKRDGAFECEEITDQETKQACLLNYAGSPLTAYNVLGQSNVNNTFACGDPLNSLGMDECLTKPTRLMIIDNKLYIADSGNNRIVIHNTLPINGCDANAYVGFVLQRECTPSSVIGKAGLFDTTLKYELSLYGNSALHYPTDMNVKDNNLYIADTKNNRIVRMDNFTNVNAVNCRADTWGTPQCRFNGVYGQKTFFSSDSIESFYLSDSANFLAPTPLKNVVADAYLNIPKRYFRYPSRIIFNKDNKMMVLSNENLYIPNQIGGYAALRSRISIFNPETYEPFIGTCSSATFDSGGCDSSLIIGQEEANKFPIVNSTQPSSYDTLASGMHSLMDFDIIAIPGENPEDPFTEAMIAVNASNNRIYVWRNWENILTAGNPAQEIVDNPAGSPNPTTGQLYPNLNNLCGVKIEKTQKNIFVQDCGTGRRVYEIQSYKLPDL